MKSDKDLDGHKNVKRFNKKDKILKKEQLTSRADIIIQKYKK